jgi:hypothetical protein
VLTLAFNEQRTASTLEEEFDRLRLEVWLALTLVFTTASTASTLDDEFERERLEV